MEILLLIAVIIVAAAGLFVAGTFNRRARENFSPLMNDTADIIVKEFAETGEKLLEELQTITQELELGKRAAGRLEAGNTELSQQMQAVEGELRRHSGTVRQLQTALTQQMGAVTDEARRGTEAIGQVQAGSAELRQQLEQVAGELQRNKELLVRLGEQAAARPVGPGTDAAELNYRIAGFAESLAEQSARISGIYRYVVRRETPDVSSTEDGWLLLAMLEAESYVDSKGWGDSPRLYALTAATSTVGLRDIDEDALVIVEQERLGDGDGDLMEALGSIRWPTDVVGCVLVTELAALPARNGAGADIDLPTAGQWTGPHPDGRPVRIAVAVGRGGEHKCGFRIKGDDELQVRSDLAGDLVAALAATF